MSLILDALKKAETERNGAPTAAPISGEITSPEENSKPVKIWQWLGVGIFLIGVISLGYILLFRSDTELTDTAVTPESQSNVSHGRPSSDISKSTPLPSAPAPIITPTPILTPTPTMMVEQTTEALAPTIDSPTIAVNTTPAPEAAAEQEPISNPREEVSVGENSPAEIAKQQLIKSMYEPEQGEEIQTSELKSIAESDEELPDNIKKLYAEEEAAASAKSPKKITKETTSSPPSAVIDVNTESVSAYSNVKLIKELPFSTQEDIPTLMYTEHNYVGKTGNSIVINGKRAKEGGSIGSGIRVEQILEDGLLLRKGNYQFKMFALNSWLNY